jgi:hypothetical protein
VTTSIITSKMDFAIEAQRRGFKPFPLKPDSAKPAFEQGDLEATQNEAKLLEWWRENPSYNVGISTENLLTLRITERCSPATCQDLAALLTRQGVPSSARTIRGRFKTGVEICLHFSLPVGATVEAQSDVLFAGIDVLSDDDFVVGPGSLLEDHMCKFVDDESLSPASPWLIGSCSAFRA